MSFGDCQGHRPAQSAWTGRRPRRARGIRIEMDIQAKNARYADLDDLLQFAQAHSPVCNAVCRPVPVVNRASEARKVR
jgi:hypothetical protein